MKICHHKRQQVPPGEASCQEGKAFARPRRLQASGDSRAPRCATPVSLVQMVPTLLELCGVPTPAGLDGSRSLSEIRFLNLTFFRLSVSSSRMLGHWHCPGCREDELCRLGQRFQALWGLHPKRKSFSRLCVAQIICHSACTFPSPRSRNLRNPRPSLICPKTGSTTALRSL